MILILIVWKAPSAPRYFGNFLSHFSYVTRRIWDHGERRSEVLRRKKLIFWNWLEVAKYTSLLLHDLLLCMYELIFSSFLCGIYTYKGFDKSPCFTKDKQFERDIILNRRVWSFLCVVHLRFALPKIPAKVVVKFAIVSSPSTSFN